MPAFDKCFIRTLRSSSSSSGLEGTRLNAAQQAVERPQQEVVENTNDSDIATTKGMSA